MQLSKDSSGSPRCAVYDLLISTFSTSHNSGFRMTSRHLGYIKCVENKLKTVLTQLYKKQLLPIIFNKQLSTIDCCCLTQGSVFLRQRTYVANQ